MYVFLTDKQLECSPVPSYQLREQSSGDTGTGLSVINRRLQIPDANTPSNTEKLFHNWFSSWSLFFGSDSSERNGHDIDGGTRLKQL